MPRRLIFTLGLTLALPLSACHSPDAPKAKHDEGREETRNIRNTEAIGYSGDAIADKVDAALDANDQRKQQLDEEIDKQTGATDQDQSSE